MTPRQVARLRLPAQRVISHAEASPAEVVAALGAIQAQDYLGSLWAVGLRTPHATEAEVEQAIAERVILRSWPMRGTLHFVAPADLCWMLALFSPRLIAGSAGRNRQLELDDDVFRRSRKALVAALQGGQSLTREEVYSTLERSKISPAGQRGYHILWRLAQEGLLCCGARRGKQPTFALLDEWSPPPTKTLDREESLAELARRYFQSHGPATLADFTWWSGLKITEARAALDSVAGELQGEEIAEVKWWMSSTQPSTKIPHSIRLLPGFDEFILGYTDRGISLEPQYVQAVIPGTNGMFLATIVNDGRVVGTWKREIQKRSVSISATFFAPPKKAEVEAAAAEAECYGRFLGRETKFAVQL